jgi:HAD superfamily hydrolase (TIGR01509 family)
MIRAVVFDLGGVIEVVDDDRWLAQWIARWEALAGCPPGSVAAAPPGATTEAGLRDRVVGALGLTSEQADQLMTEFWDAYCGTLNEELCDFVRGLRGQYQTAALSNSADGARREEERRFRLSELFDVLVYSHEVGVEKPDLAIYRFAEAALGVEPHEIVFLDDRESAVDGALAAGWNAVLHQNTAGSIEEIRRIVG